MKKNMGKTDKILRAILAIALILIAIITGIYWIALIALVPLLTISMSYCPLYAPFKISTIKKK